MRLLLDTHAFLWFVLNDPQLSPGARVLIADPNNTGLISPASYWEIAIKVSIGKFTLTTGYGTFMQQALGGYGFQILPIEPRHTEEVAKLPFHHRDPFDRLLVAQAKVEQVPIVGVDVVFDSYGVQRLW